MRRAACLPPTTRYRCLRCGHPGRLDTPCLCRYGPPLGLALSLFLVRLGTLGLLAVGGVLGWLLWGGRTP